ncbi:MAG: hypothetical protein AB7H71_05635 [Alphaproteobacteria bacterium]
MTAVLVVSARMPGGRERGDIDETARKVVLDAYRESSGSRAAKPFDEALKRYLRRYPHVKKELAGHAVAHILATAEV